jgi:hypothetical protein
MIAIAWSAAIMLALPLQAVVTTVSTYRLGESDPGAASGAAGADPTVATTGGPDLSRFGTPVYSNLTPLASSTLSMLFNGTDARYEGGVTSVLTDNFGMEAWVRSDGSVVANATLAYNGNTATSGWGLFRFGATWGYLYGGVVIGGGAPLTADTWTHLAVVRDSGLTTFYVNGVPFSTNASAPNPPAGNTLIGGNPFIPTEYFDGRIDEVRVFTFASGAFQITDLNLTAPAPVVTSISPTSGPQSGGTVVTITGTGFSTTATTVTFGANAATAVSCSSTTTCTATSPAGTGTVNVRVTVASQTSADVPADDYTYLAPAAVPAAIPSLSGTALMLLAGLMAMSAAIALRSRI